MGYTNPTVNLNQSGAVINNEIRRFNSRVDEELNEVNARQAANIEANMGVLEQKQKQRALGDKVWWQIEGQYKPEAGWKEVDRQMLDEAHERYYQLLGCEDPKCIQEMQKLKAMPEMMSKQKGAYATLLAEKQAADKLTEGSPGSYWAANDPKLTQLLEHGAYSKKIYDSETGHLMYHLEDPNGKAIIDPDTGKQMIIDGTTFLGGALDGSLGVEVYGDSKGIRGEMHTQLYKEGKFSSMIQNISDYSDPQNQEKIKQNQVALDEFHRASKNPQLYDKVLNDNSSMRTMYPQMVEGLFEQAQAGDKDAKIALEALDADLRKNGGKGILGTDQVVGGGDDLSMSTIYKNQSLIGAWNGSDVQKGVGQAFMQYDDPNDNVTPKLGQYTTDRQIGLTPMNAAQDASHKLNQRKTDIQQDQFNQTMALNQQKMDLEERKLQQKAAADKAAAEAQANGTDFDRNVYNATYETMQTASLQAEEAMVLKNTEKNNWERSKFIASKLNEQDPTRNIKVDPESGKLYQGDLDGDWFFMGGANLTEKGIENLLEREYFNGGDKHQKGQRNEMKKIIEKQQKAATEKAKKKKEEQKKNNQNNQNKVNLQNWKTKLNTNTQTTPTTRQPRIDWGTT